MARAIPGAQYRVLHGVGHLANLERPALFQASLRELLDTLPS
jgi:pimeloyl-ACP methyl ester carboxylesterase